jgi:hypothetical protein
MAAFDCQHKVDGFIVRRNKFNLAVEVLFDALYKSDAVIIRIAPAAVFDSDSLHKVLTKWFLRTGI